jgi:lysine 6-dehydrogenase
MDPRPRYAILGAGKQGLAAAYDVLRFGGPAALTVADASPRLARETLARAARLAGAAARGVTLRAASLDAADRGALVRLLRGHRAVLSALPYPFNPGAAAAAVAARCHYCDLGGHFETTRRVLAHGRAARRAGVALIPDCGVSPGLCNSLAVLGLERLDRARDVRLYCGGLPQHPRGPLGYKIVFNLEGLLGNYYGAAYVLRGGKVKVLPPLSERETLSMAAPLGRLEAAVTGGATSTCPWTFRGKLRTYEYKTLRYPGHWGKIEFLHELGLLDEAPVAVGGRAVSPRKLFAAAAGPRLAYPDDRDLLVMRVVVSGVKDGRPAEQVFDLLDRYDPRTGFTAMQRTTGFSAAIVLEMLARGRIRSVGAAPLETSVPAGPMLAELRRRGIRVKETFRRPSR